MSPCIVQFAQCRKVLPACASAVPTRDHGWFGARYSVFDLNRACRPPVDTFYSTLRCPLPGHCSHWPESHSARNESSSLIVASSAWGEASRVPHRWRSCIVPAVESVKRYTIDPDDPRAPSEDEWARMSEHERRWVVDHMPSEFPPSELAPPEGDVHYNHVRSVRDALRGFFRRMRRKMYIGSTLPVYYPGERMFSVDALAVLDVEDGPRNSWMVSAEGRGLDFALEIHWLGHRTKDFERNVAWFPRLGIPEYFVFDARHLKLRGYRLPEGGAAHYEPIVPQGGRYTSRVLGLELGIEGPRLRFYSGSALVPDADDLIARLDGALAESQARAEEEARRAEEEARRAQVAEERLAAVLAELESLKKRI